MWARSRKTGTPAPGILAATGLTSAFEGAGKQALETGRNRLLVAGAVIAFAFVAVAVRLVDIAVLKGGEPRIARSTPPHAATARADIVDRNGVLLATSLPVVSLSANPREVLEPAEAAAKLVAVFPDLEREQIETKLASRARFVWIKRNLTPRQKYEANRLGIPGLEFQHAERRVYPQGRAAAHVLGLTDVDGRGIAGVERTFDARLADGDGPIALSLDVRIQDVLREELDRQMKEFRAIGAAGVVLDARTFEVLAMVSLPDFDANDSSAVAGTEPAFNRVTKGVYEMGSTFKLFTAAMALDSGTVALSDGYDASRPIQIARFTITDYKGKNRWLSVPEILVYSSNIGAAKMALDVGVRLQRAYLDGFGMLKPAPVELPETGAPLAPARWREINTMTIAYGHGLAVSPLQLAGGVAAIVNGGVLRPVTILKREPGEVPEGTAAISEETSRHMRELMRLVVVHGTGKSADVKGYAVGGKTGTADKQVGRGYRRDARMASFVGAFPIQEPRFVVLAMIDEPKGNASTHGYATGGWIAAPVVRRIVERLAPLAGLAPDDTIENPPMPPTRPRRIESLASAIAGGGDGVASH
ncbi:MAG: penicillin-binding protein 2 [Rhodospirillales bacterium]|nr:penicillin-binding protein 2 [Rhodospirillales bacterium]